MMVFDVPGTAMMAIPRFPCPAKAAWYGLDIHHALHLSRVTSPGRQRGPGNGMDSEQDANPQPRKGNSTAQRSAHADIDPFPKPPRVRASFSVLSPHMSRYSPCAMFYFSKRRQSGKET